VAGIGALTVSILGLAGVQPAVMISIATLLLGLGFLILGDTGALSHILFRARSSEERWNSMNLWRGVAIAWLAGIVGVIVGILGFVSAAAATYGGVMALVYGLALIGCTGLTQPTSAAEFATGAGPRRFLVLTLHPAMGTEFFIGLGAVILGVLALFHFAPLVLVLVSLLAVGSTLAFVATAVCSATMHLLAVQCQQQRQV
jgi:hypothetical protein